MTQLILVMTLVVTLSGGGAEGESQRRWVTPPPAAAPPKAVAPTQSRQVDLAPHRKDDTTDQQTPLCYPLCKVTGNPQRQVSHQDEYQIKENITWILETDTSTAADTINTVKKREAISSTEKIHDMELHTVDDTVNEIEDTSSNKDTISGVFNKGDLAIPYNSLGWFSKAVEAAMDGSLYIGLALGIMFISASVLSGAIGVFGETCLICAFIGYANTLGP